MMLSNMTEETNTPIDQDQQPWDQHIDDALEMGNQPDPTDVAIQSAARKINGFDPTPTTSRGDVVPFKSRGENLTKAELIRALKIGGSVLGAVGVVVLASALVLGPSLQRHNNTNIASGVATDQAAASTELQDAVKLAASTYSPDEQLIGTFTIDAQNPTVTDGIDNVLKAHPEVTIDPANLGLSKQTAELSAQDVEGDDNSVSAGDAFQVVKEPIQGKEVIIVEPSLPPAAPLGQNQ